MKTPTFLFLLIVLFTGCNAMQPVNTEVVSPTAYPVKEVTPSPPLPTLSHQTLTPTLTVQANPTWTLPPSLSLQDARIQVKDLLQTNRGCQLPCWWGITPGKTEWQEARDFLFPMAIKIREYDDFIFLVLAPPYLVEDSSGVQQSYTVQNGVVQAIQLGPQDFNPYLQPQAILTTLGVPKAIYLSGTIERDVHWQSFNIVLYYPDQGILAKFNNGLLPIQSQQILDVCFSEINYAEIYLWAPNSLFQKDVASLSDESGIPYFPIADVTNLTNDEVYKVFTSTVNKPCIKTPAEKWPGHD